MSETASEVEREVEASRAHVEETVDALKQKMSIGQMVDDAAHYFQESGGSQFLSNLGAQIRDNPLPLVLMGVGLAWLMSGRGSPYMGPRHRNLPGDPNFGLEEEYRYRRTVAQGMSSDDDRKRSDELEDDGQASGVMGDVSATVERLGKGVANAAGELKSSAARVGSAAAGFGESAYSAARSGGSPIVDRASRAGSDAYDTAADYSSRTYRSASHLGGRARRSVSDLLDTEPLVLGALGLAVGAAVGAFLPSTETEDRYIGPARDRIRDEVKGFAREKFEQGKVVAAEVYEDVKDKAAAKLDENENLTTDDLKVAAQSTSVNDKNT